MQVKNDKYFWRPLMLPSAGLSYDSLAYIRPITGRLQLFNMNPFYGFSNLEYMTSVVMHYGRFSPRLEDLYMADLIYMWLTILNEESRYTAAQCSSCGHEQEILIDLQELEITHRHSYEKTKYETDVIGVPIEYRPRTVMDNFQFAHIELESKTKDEKEFLRAYIAPQIVKVHGTKVDTPYVMESLQKIATDQLVDLYNTLSIAPFGAENEFFYHCIKCKSKERALIFDDVSTSVYRPRQLDAEASRDALETMLKLANMRVQSFDEILDIPLELMDMYVKIYNEEIEPPLA